MGYRIDYKPVKKVRDLEKRFSRVPALTAVCLVLFLLLVNLFWQEGMAVIRGILIPGDPAVTVSALEGFALELRMGEELGSAFTTFCRRIIAGAQAGAG